MELRSRRNFLLAGTGLALFAGAVGLRRLHQRLPPRDVAAEERFRATQAMLLAESGGRVNPRFVEIANPPMRVQVLEGGDGEPVLLLHGGDGMAAQWEPLLSRLAVMFHVFAPDRPGCGLTEMYDYTGVPFREHAVAFVASTMDALGLKRAAVVGNSMGGYFGLVFALAHPERVSRLITVGEPAGSSPDIPLSHRLLAIRGVNGLMYSTILRPGTAATAEGFRRILVAHPERLSQTYLACCTAASEIPGATESWLTMLEDVVPDAHSRLSYALRPELGRLAMPVLMIWGEKDSFGPASLASEMAGLMPAGRAETVLDAGHLAWLDQPDRVEALVSSFLQA